MYFGMGIGTRIHDAAQGSQIVSRGVDGAPVPLALWLTGFVNSEVLWVGMRGDKIHRQGVGLAVGQEVLDPHGAPRNGHRVEGLSGGTRLRERRLVQVEVAGRGSAHTQSRINLFDRLCRSLVELKILLLRAVEETSQVRLVPYFEVPLAHLIEPVARHAMLYCCTYQGRPFVVVRGGTAVGLPPESCTFHDGELLGREAQLDKGPHTFRQHAIEYIIHVLEVINRVALRVFPVDKHIVVEQSVKAHILKTVITSGRLQLLLPGRAESLVSAARTDYLAPEVHQGLARCAGLRGDANRSVLRGSRSRRNPLRIFLRKPGHSIGKAGSGKTQQYCKGFSERFHALSLGKSWQD